MSGVYVYTALRSVDQPEMFDFYIWIVRAKKKKQSTMKIRGIQADLVEEMNKSDWANSKSCHTSRFWAWYTFHMRVYNFFI